ncbi:iron ABC transporter ATP-binding protein [Amnibacterium flavum]|uniref:Iron ABC transporter ATP-binding protein n=1 Tax=Amnibacterium flavum TaxID=2173173 RepID=A0A2V1HUA0_9MICO|nr:iron ABC transporter ATP-binding protein [Amnibacterium flavum]PVZ96195.1 iron ABC transporter ATP-binding protein [Amnibacterium flavum]
MSMSYRARSIMVGRGLLAASLLAASVVLAGCTSNPVAPAPAETTDAPAPVETTTAPVASPEPTTPTGIPITFTCDQLLTPEQVYAFNANFGANPQYVVEPGTVAAEIVALQGISCGWLNQTSNELIEVAVAHLEPADIEARKNELVISSHLVPTYNNVADEGYFTTDGTIGRADVFVGEYWLMMRSSVFFEPGDAISLVEPAATNLQGVS